MHPSITAERILEAACGKKVDGVEPDGGKRAELLFLVV